MGVHNFIKRLMDDFVSTIQRKGLFEKQPKMQKLLFSLLPILLFAIYLFGWRVLFLLIFVSALGMLAEYPFERRRGRKPSESILVTCALYTLTLPPSVPFWTAAAGLLFGVILGKQVFGGFGRNIFNPALLGRFFIYHCFPVIMTGRWVHPFSGFPGGFAAWTPVPIDAASAATPLFTAELGTKFFSFIEIFFGHIPGSIGETSAFFILLSGLYLIFTGTASWRLIASTLSGMMLTQGLFYFTGAGFMDPFTAVISGGFLFASVFMATDPVTAPISSGGQILYGMLIGAFTALIREFSHFAEGVMFAVLIMNCFVPLIDYASLALRRIKQRWDGRLRGISINSCIKS